MPFQSTQQSRWAFATGQPFAKRWAKLTHYRTLPKRKRRHKALSLAQLEAFVSSPHYDPATAAAIAARIPLLPSLKGEQIAPGVTRIRGNLCNVHGKYGPCDTGLAGKKPKKGRAGRTPATPKLTDAQRAQARDAKRQQNADAVAQRMAETDTGLSPSGSKGLLALRAGQQPDKLLGDGLVTMELAERAQDGSYRMTPAGRAAVSAMQAGDYQRAVDTISRAGDAASARRARQTEQATRRQDAAGKRQTAQAQRELSRREREQARAKRQAEQSTPSGGKRSAAQATEKPVKVRPTKRLARSSAPSVGGVGGAAPTPRGEPAQTPAKQIAPALQTAVTALSEGDDMSDAQIAGLIRNGLVKLNKDGEPVLTAAGLRATMKAQTDQEKAMFANMGGGGSGGSGGKGGGKSKLWPKGPSGKRTPQAAAAEHRGSSGSGGKPKPSGGGGAAKPKPKEEPLPQDLRNMTPSEHRAVVNDLAKMPLAELRQRQNLTRQQMQQAHADYMKHGPSTANERGMANLQIRDQHITAAIDKQVFGTPKPPKPVPRDGTPGERLSAAAQRAGLPVAALPISPSSANDFHGGRENVIDRLATLPKSELRALRSDVSAHLKPTGNYITSGDRRYAKEVITYQQGLIDAAIKRSTTKDSSFRIFKDATGRHRWVAQSSTAYQDRDREIVSTKALADDCAYADSSGQYGPLRWWHAPGLDLGDCDFNAMHGRVLIESGTFRSPQIAQKIAAAADELEISLGFLHLPTEPDANGVFHHIRKFERSLVPRGKASNRFTAFRVKESPMFDPTKVAALKTLGFSDTDIARLQAQAEATEKAASDQGVAYKADEPPIGTVTTSARPGQFFTVANGDTYVKSPSDLDPSGLYFAVKAAPPPIAEDAAMIEEDAMEPMDEEMDDAALTLSAGDLAAIGEAIRAGIAQVMGALDLEKKVASHVQGFMAPFQATKDAKDAETAEQIAALQQALKEARAELAELTGTQPAIPYRASAAPSTILTDAALLAQTKQITNGAGPFDDIIQGLGLNRS